MNYIPKPTIQPSSVDPSTKPRYLDDTEIEYILDHLPQVRGVYGGARETARNGIKESLMPQLRKIQIVQIIRIVTDPKTGKEYEINLAIEELIKDMQAQFERSRVVPETAVGITAAEGMGRTATQGALNSFHSSGSAKSASVGIEAMQELINASSKRKNPSTTITFKDKTLTFFQVLQKRQEFVGLTIDRLMLADEDNIDEVGNFDHYPFEDVYATLFDIDIPDSSYMMRIYLDLDVIYQYRVSMERIVTALEELTGIVCIPSPLPFVDDDNITKAFIDIYPIESQISQPLKNQNINSIKNPSRIFLQAIVIPFLEKTVVQGIPGITGVFPVKQRITKIIRDQLKTSNLIEYDPENTSEDNLARDISEEEFNRTWFLTYNELLIRVDGIQPEDLLPLLALLGIVVVEVGAEYLIIIMPENIKEKPLEYIDRRIREAEAEEEKRFDETIKKMSKDPNIIPIEPLADPIISASRIYTMDTNGNNLIEIYARDDVDPNYTYSNNFHELNKVLGVDAAAAFYERDLTNVILGNDSYVTPRNIALIRDFVFNQGKPLGLTFTGISAQPGGYLSLSTYQRSVEVYAKAAAAGKIDRLEDTSASIYVGKRINVGSGAANPIIPDEYKAKLEQAFNINQEAISAAEFDSHYIQSETTLVTGSETGRDIDLAPEEQSRIISSGIANEGVSSDPSQWTTANVVQVQDIPTDRLPPKKMLIGQELDDIFESLSTIQANAAPAQPITRVRRVDIGAPVVLPPVEIPTNIAEPNTNIERGTIMPITVTSAEIDDLDLPDFSIDTTATRVAGERQVGYVTYDE